MKKIASAYNPIIQSVIVGLQTINLFRAIQISPFYMFFIVVFSACHQRPAEIPFPKNETEFSAPVAQKFKFTEPVPIQFVPIKSDSKEPPKAVHFDIDQLPSKPFTVGDFKPLKEPIQTKPLDFSTLESSPFNLEEVPAQPFKMKQYVLPQPQKVKAGIPTILPNSVFGALQFGSGLGLPGDRVSTPLIGPRGKLWFGTEIGPVRYDGDYLYVYSLLNVLQFGSKVSNPNMTFDKEGNLWLSTLGQGIFCINTENNIVKYYQSATLCYTIICDHSGLIWVGRYGSGLSVIDPQKQSIKNINFAKNGSRENSITCIKEDRQNRIWLGFMDYIGIMDAERKQIKKITEQEGMPVRYKFKFFEDSQGDMWVDPYLQGVNIISLKGKTLSTLNQKNGINRIIIAFAEDSAHRIWMFGKDTSFVLNKERTALKQILIGVDLVDNRSVGGSLLDRFGNIWLGTTNKGIAIIDTKGALPENISTEQGLVNDRVWGIMEDKENKIWLSTWMGVNIYDPSNDQIKTLGTKQGLIDDGTRGFATDSLGNIVINTFSGISIIDRKKKTLTNYGKAQQLGFRIINCLPTSGSQLWLSTIDHGSILYDTKQNTAKQIGKFSGRSNDMLKDRQGNIWICTDSGISIINPNNNTVKYLQEKEGLYKNQVYVLVQHPNGEIWAGAREGISIINTDNFTITNLSSKEGLIPQDIYDLVERNGTIYAGSSDGIFVINKPADSVSKNLPWQFVKYGKEEGFPYTDYNANTALATRDGKIWWAAEPIVTVMNQMPVLDSLVPRVNINGINILDVPMSFTKWASYKNYLTEGDTLWNPDNKNFYLKNTLPKEDGYLQEHHIRWDSITPLYKLPIGLTLPYDQNSVSFSFSNDDIKGRDKIIYRYILEGADKTWGEASNKSTSKSYFNLTAGQYVFKVCSKGFNGIWSNVDEFSFTILPPWWQTWWAYMLYALGAIIVLATYSRYRSRQLVKKNILLEMKVKKRTAELSRSLEDLKSTQSQLIQSEKMASLGELTAGIAHEIQNPLNFVNNFSEVNKELIGELNAERKKPNAERDEQLENEILNDLRENAEKINFHGKRADAIVKGMLQHSRASTGTKEPTNINALADEYLRLSYHGLRAKDKSFNAEMKTDFDDSIGKINIISQDIGRVLLNLYNNAFYAVSEKLKVESAKQDTGYRPLVTVQTRKSDNQIFITVSDNGNGIPQHVVGKIFQPFFTTKPTGKGTGLGLSLSYDIVKAHAGELKVETKEGEGTSFSIQLPV